MGRLVAVHGRQPRRVEREQPAQGPRLNSEKAYVRLANTSYRLMTRGRAGLTSKCSCAVSRRQDCANAAVRFSRAQLVPAVPLEVVRVLRAPRVPLTSACAVERR